MSESKTPGADWLRLQGFTLSSLGEAVAELLEILVGGIYRLYPYDIRSTAWNDTHCIEIRWNQSLSTYDDSLLTRLVILAHDRCIRVELSPRNFNYLTIRFHPRQREGGIFERHPTIEQALNHWRKYHPLEEPAHDC